MQYVGKSPDSASEKIDKNGIAMFDCMAFKRTKLSNYGAILRWKRYHPVDPCARLYPADGTVPL
jgi:hypothetical protein